MTLGAKLKSHFSVSGRMSAHQYRRLMLRLFCFWLAVLVISVFLASRGARFAGYVAVAVFVATLVLNCTAFIRRLHDRNRTGWWLLFSIAAFFVAYSLEGMVKAQGGGLTGIMLASLGIILVNFWLFVETFVRRGTSGPNRFGSDPREEGQLLPP